MKEIARTSDIKSLIVDVSEEITQKNLLNFACTTLDLNNIEYSSSDIIYCNFLKYSKQYQLFVFHNSFKYMIIELLNNQDKKIEKLNDSCIFRLYISKAFFVIYENNKVYTYQVLNQEYSNEELLNFINKSFNITIFEVIEINDIELNKIVENDFDNEEVISSSFLNINKKSNKSFLLYLFYLLLCILSTIVYDTYESKLLEDKKLSEINTNKKEYIKTSKILMFKPFKSEYIKLINTANKFNLKIISFTYNHESMNIKLSTKKKDSIYSFLNDYQKNLLGNSIIKVDSKNIFVGTINVKIN